MDDTGDVQSPLTRPVESFIADLTPILLNLASATGRRPGSPGGEDVPPLLVEQ